VLHSHEVTIEDDEDDVPVLLMDVEAEQKMCDILGHLRRRDRTLSDDLIAIDTKAPTDCVSRRLVDDDGLLIDTTRRRRIAGATADMTTMSDGIASFDVVTSSGETRLDAIVVIIGAPETTRSDDCRVADRLRHQPANARRDDSRREGDAVSIRSDELFSKTVVIKLRINSFSIKINFGLFYYSGNV
jgi:hypothetical protein